MSWSAGAGLEGRGVLVTGAAGGIGSAVASAFAEAGARVLATDLDAAAIDALVRGLPGAGHAGVASDLRRRGEPERLVALARGQLGDLHAVVNLAAVVRRRSTLDAVTEEDWDEQHDINLKAAFLLARAAGAVMVDQGRGGRIVLLTSQAWWTGGFAGSTVYAATKGGVVSLARGLARTFAPHGITVNTVAPGLVDTPMITAGVDPDAYREMVRQIPLGRIAEPGEIAGVVVFLASAHAGYITGATINVSGGMLMY